MVKIFFKIIVCFLCSIFFIGCGLQPTKNISVENHIPKSKIFLGFHLGDSKAEIKKRWDELYSKKEIIPNDYKKPYDFGSYFLLFDTKNKSDSAFFLFEKRNYYNDTLINLSFTCATPMLGSRYESSFDDKNDYSHVTPLKELIHQRYKSQFQLADFSKREFELRVGDMIIEYYSSFEPNYPLNTDDYMVMGELHERITYSSAYFKIKSYENQLRIDSIYESNQQKKIKNSAQKI